MDQPRFAFGLELAAQVADVDVERIRGVAEVVAPYALVDERAWKHLAGVAHVELEQVRLSRRQLEAAGASSCVHRAEVEAEVGETEDVCRLLLERPAKERAQSGEEFLERERLRQVVVGA